MLVLHVRDNGEFEEVYFGPFAPVKAASRHSARDSKEMIAITKLRVLQTALKTESAEAAVAAVKVLPEPPIVDEE